MRVWSLFCGSGSVYQVAQGRNIGQGSLKNALRASLLWLYVQIWVEIEMRQEKTAPEGLSQRQIASLLVFWGLSLRFTTGDLIQIAPYMAMLSVSDIVPHEGVREVSQLSLKKQELRDIVKGGSLHPFSETDFPE